MAKRAISKQPAERSQRQRTERLPRNNQRSDYRSGYCLHQHLRYRLPPHKLHRGNEGKTRYQRVSCRRRISQLTFSPTASRISGHNET